MQYFHQKCLPGRHIKPKLFIAPTDAQWKQLDLDSKTLGIRPTDVNKLATCMTQYGLIYGTEYFRLWVEIAPARFCKLQRKTGFPSPRRLGQLSSQLSHATPRRQNRS